MRSLVWQSGKRHGINSSMNKYLALFLMKLPGIGRKNLRFIEKSLLEKNVNIGEDTVLLGTKIYDGLMSAEIPMKYSKSEFQTAFEKFQRTLDMAEKLGINFVGYDDDMYPINLRGIVDPPFYLFYKGDISIVNNQISIAVIGTRNPTEHGRKIGMRFGEVLAESGITVVSGLALGCDTCGHMGCLKKDGKTVAVMAEGLHKVYPFRNKKIAEEILYKGGCIMSEYSPGHNAFKSNFVERDRIESGLSAGVIVVETDVVGGTMHTVDFAITQNRIVAAYKHSVRYNEAKQAQGNIELINTNRAIPLRKRDEVMNFIEMCKQNNNIISQLKQTVVYEPSLFE